MIRKIVLNILAALFRIVPRDPDIWVTGKIVSWEYDNAPPAFFDNAKYFFLYLVNHTDEKVYWISSSDREAELLESMGLPVVRFPSLKGIYIALRAKFFFHHYGPDQIDPILQRGSIQLDFWHGTPLKKIRYDITGKPQEKHNFYLDFMKKGGAEYVFSTSRYLSEKVLSGAFAATSDKLLDFGYPRLDILGVGNDENLAFCRKYSPELISYIDRTGQYDQVILYMPTYRDDDPDYFEKARIDFDAMGEALRRINGIFFLKLHPLTRYAGIKAYDNIVQISNDVDIYPFLAHTDYLVTDYSSIFFDYLVLDKEIIFIPYDIGQYIQNRELYFNYDEITPGIKYHSFDEFIRGIEHLPALDYGEERKRVRDMMIEDYHFDACEKTYQFIKRQFKQQFQGGNT